MYSHFVFCSTEEDRIHHGANLHVVLVVYPIYTIHVDAQATKGSKAPAGWYSPNKPEYSVFSTRWIKTEHLHWPKQCAFEENISIDRSHRYGRHQVACREPAGSYDKTTRTAICFEHKTQYLLIRVPYTPIVVFWHISNIPPMISQSQINCNCPTFYIAAIFVKYCYTTDSWLL